MSENNSELLNAITEYLSLGINQQLDYDKFYLYSIITHSTAIEGSTVTEIENQLLFDEGITSKRPMVEQLMNLDLKRAYEQSFLYAENHELITVELLCNLSSLVMCNTGTQYTTMGGNFSSAKGDLRLLNVSAGRGGKSYLPWQKIPERLQAFCDWINQERNKIVSSEKKDVKQIYELSFEVHYRLVTIHPWADGNGRMSRLVMNMIQYEAGVIPSIVKKENRADYIQNLAESEETDDSKQFIGFMLKHHIENLREQIEQYKKSIQNDTLKPQNDTLNDTLKLSDKEIKILGLIQADLHIKTDELMEKTGYSRPTVMRAIKALKERNILQRVDSKKTGSWKIL